MAEEDFERPIIEIELELARLRTAVEAGEHSKGNQVLALEKRLDKLRTEIYGSLTAYQRVQLSRHADRPFTLDYINKLLSNFLELKGDRLFADDPAVIAGIGTFQGQAVAVAGHQRGRSTQERIYRNFGMSRPEGNRKAQRIYQLAEKFKLPLILFIDTPGAFPGIEAEERGQAESIARNLMVLCGLQTPVISIVIGEGGSGGALAFGICDRLLMMENAIYSVISAEGCASILWGKEESDKITEHAKLAAEALKLTAKSVWETGIIDEIIKEPVGGAHKDPQQAIENVGAALARHLSSMMALEPKLLLEKRYEKFRKIGPVA